MPNQQLPDVVIVGAKNVTSGIAAALNKTGQFAHIFEAASLSELHALTNDLPDGALAYLFSPTAAEDMDGISLTQVVPQIQSRGHYVLGIGLDQASEQFATSLNMPILKPGMNLPREIAKAAGITPASTQPAVREQEPRHETPPTPQPEPAPQPPQQQRPQESVPQREAIQQGMLWKRARDEVADEGRRELVPIEDSSSVWKGALDESRRRGDLQPGHHARGFVIAFAARKGGVGKTTLSVNSAAYLGRALAGSGRRVVLVDMNLQQADIGDYIGHTSPNVSDLIANPARLSPEQIETCLVPNERDNFYTLLGPQSIKAGNPVQANVDLYKQILDLLRDRFDYILIDTPVAEYYHQVLNLVLPMANYILVPVSPARVTLGKISDWLSTICSPRHVNGLGIDPHKIGLVLNRAKLGIGLDPGEVEEQFSGWKFVGMLPDSDEWQLAENTGHLIGSNPTKDLDGAFRHMLHEATGDPHVSPTARSHAAPSKPKKKGNWFKRLLS